MFGSRSLPRCIETSGSDEPAAPTWRTWIFGILRRRRDRALAAAVAELRAAQAPPTDRQLARLRFGCGNRTWAASVDVLRELSARVMAAQVGVLECGSGASTVLIGALSAQRRLPVVSLEHSKLWHDKTRRLLESAGLHHVSLRRRRIVEHDGFDWYELPMLRPERRFDLVFVDGPPGSTHGGRYGVLPCMRERLTDDCVVILDDADRDLETQILDRWQALLPGSIITRRGTYAVLERRGTNCVLSG